MPNQWHRHPTKYDGRFSGFGGIGATHDEKGDEPDNREEQSDQIDAPRGVASYFFHTTSIAYPF